MKTNFDFSQVPHNFSLCTYTQCKRASTCLRHLLVAHIPPTQCSFPALNPVHLAAEGPKCKYFKPDETQRFALGMKRMLDSVPHKEAGIIKRLLLDYFGHSGYYRCLNKKRPISPADQKHIKGIFRSRGIEEEPAFDEYIEMYEW